MSSRPPSHRQQRRPVDGTGIDLAATIAEIAGRQFCTVEDPVDGFDVEFFRQVEHGEILVVESS